MAKRTIDKNSYSYYKTSYRANARYRKKVGDDNYGAMLSKAEFRELAETGLSVKDIVYNQFHFYTRDVAKGIQQSLKKEGFDLSLRKVQNRDYSAKVFERMREIYWEVSKERNSKEAAAYISYSFYGS